MKKRSPFEVSSTPPGSSLTPVVVRVRVDHAIRELGSGIDVTSVAERLGPELVNDVVAGIEHARSRFNYEKAKSGPALHPRQRYQLGVNYAIDSLGELAILITRATGLPVVVVVEDLEEKRREAVDFSSWGRS